MDDFQKSSTFLPARCQPLPAHCTHLLACLPVCLFLRNICFKLLTTLPVVAAERHNGLKFALQQLRMLQSGLRQLARRSVRRCAAVSELATAVAHAAPPTGQRCFLMASTPSLLHCVAQVSTFSQSGLFASDARLSPPLLGSVQRGTAGVLLTRGCSGGPAGTSSDNERPLIDADTVALLLETGVWSTEEEVRNELFKTDKTKRWPLETVSAVWAFLVSVLEEPGALTAVRRRPVSSSDQEGEKPARCVRGEKDDKGRPLFGDDTVAFVLELGVVGRTKEEVRDELFRAEKTHRWPFDTALAAWAFLESVLEKPGALAAVRRRPNLLTPSTNKLRGNWDVLLLVFG